MDKELKAKWVAALRGGKIQQAQQVLIDNQGGMCCLGVSEYVCNTSRELIEQQRDNLVIIHRDVNLTIRHTLASMNDGSNGFKRHSFDEIAEWIERTCELVQHPKH